MDPDILWLNDPEHLHPTPNFPQSEPITEFFSAKCLASKDAIYFVDSVQADKLRIYIHAKCNEFAYIRRYRIRAKLLRKQVTKAN